MKKASSKDHNLLTVATNNENNDMKRLLSSQSTSKPKTINKDDYEPRRLGIKSKDCQIILEYLVPSTGKRFYRVMKLTKYCP